MLTSITVHYYLKGISQFAQNIQQALLEYPKTMLMYEAVKRWEADHPEADTVGVSMLPPKLLPRLPAAALDVRHGDRAA